METATASRKKSPVGKVILWVFLTPILLALLALIVLAAALLLGKYDTPLAVEEGGVIAATEELPAMELSRRYSFDAAERTVTIRCDGADLNWLVVNYAQEAAPQIEELLSSTPLRLKRLGFEMKDGLVCLNLSLKAFGLLPLPVQAGFSVSGSGTSLTLTAEKLSVARLLSIGSEKLAETFGVDLNDLSLTLDVGEYHKRLERLKSAEVNDSLLELRCGIGTDLFSELAENPAAGRRMSLYLEPTPVLQLARNLSWGQDGQEDLDAMLAALEKDPGSYSSLRGQLLAATEPFKAKLAYEGKGSELMIRFLPDADKEAVLALRDERTAVTDEREKLFQQLLVNIAAAWHDGTLALGANGLWNTALNKDADISQLAEDWSKYESWLALSETRIILAENVNYYIYNRLKPLEEMAVTEDASFQGLDRRGYYEAVLLLTYIDGTRAVACREGNSDYGRHEMDQAAYEALLNAPFPPVFDLNIKDY